MSNQETVAGAVPSLEELSRIYSDIPENRTIGDWCEAQHIAYSSWYNLKDKPKTIKLGARKIITRLDHFIWLQRRFREQQPEV